MVKKCLNCQKEFQVKPSRYDIVKFCSKICKINFHVFYATCIICQKRFKAHKYRIKTIKFCSRNCHWKSKVGMAAWNKGLKTEIVPSTAFKKGIVPWNKKEKLYKNCKNCNKEFSVSQSLKRILHCSRECMAITYQTQLLGVNGHNWKGGISKERKTERQILMEKAEYKNWRKDVFERDDYTCQDCGQRGKKLEADHKLPWVLFPNLRFDIRNGQTLCKNCHQIKTSQFLKKYNKELFQVQLLKENSNAYA